MALRLAQVFPVSGQIPTKASLYFKRVGLNSGDAFDLGGGSVSIDASNYASLSQTTNFLVFADDVEGFTGNGFVRLSALNPSAPMPVANYPISTDTPQGYSVHLRVRSDSSSFRASLLIDGNVVKTVNESVSFGWVWVQARIGLPDRDTHVLGVRLEEDGHAIDKIYVTGDEAETVTGDGPDLTTAPFVTIHLQVFSTNNDMAPLSPLDIYAYKTTLSEVLTDDWYNFSLRQLDGEEAAFVDGYYALVVSSSGRSERNYVLWELVDNDVYDALPSAIKV